MKNLIIFFALIASIQTVLYGQANIMNEHNNAISIGAGYAGNSDATNLTYSAIATIDKQLDIGILYGVPLVPTYFQGYIWGASLSWYVLRNNDYRFYLALDGLYSKNVLRTNQQEFDSYLSAEHFYDAYAYEYGFSLGLFPRTEKEFCLLPSINILYVHPSNSSSYANFEGELSLLTPLDNNISFVITFMYDYSLLVFKGQSGSANSGGIDLHCIYTFGD